MTSPQYRARALQRAQTRARVINALDQSHRDSARAKLITVVIVAALLTAAILVLAKGM